MGVLNFHFTTMSCPCVLIYLIIVFPMLFYICKNSCTYRILISLLLRSSFLLSFAYAPLTSLYHTGGAPMTPLCSHWRCPCDPSLSTLRCPCDPVFVHTVGAPGTLSLSTLSVPLWPCLCPHCRCPCGPSLSTLWVPLWPCLCPHCGCPCGPIYSHPTRMSMLGYKWFEREGGGGGGGGGLCFCPFCIQTYEVAYVFLVPKLC